MRIERTSILRVALASLVLAAGVGTVQANDEDLAWRYAPILTFAEGEEYFPTLPFFSAFDGVDNDGDGRRDFADPDEICPVLVDGETEYFHWNRLDEWYRALPLEKKAEVTAVFYRVREAKPDRLHRILAGDAASFRRLPPHVQQILKGKKTPFRVIEYYFYYVNDQ